MKLNNTQCDLLLIVGVIACVLGMSAAVECGWPGVLGVVIGCVIMIPIGLLLGKLTK